MNFVVISSTGGAVLRALLKNDFFRERISCVVSDRQCGAIDVALGYGVKTKIYHTKNGADFSDFLLNEFIDNPPDLFVSFYTRLFRGKFLDFSKRRLVNMHPSLLPAFPGRDGFGDSIKYGVRFVGATIHFVDEGMDTGHPIIQAAIPWDPDRNIDEVRHLVFQQQCKMLLQLIKWVDEGRLIFNERGLPAILGAKYDVGEFSPNLDTLYI
jgi:phosphoribosylglycinamide formyltransferase 1